MAIGDKPNQNLFGTNYNAEDEEEKKAELAAQNAMMGAGSPTVVGAGNIPASAFGQAPAVAPFSMEAAGQVNPMMEQQSLAVPPQAPVTFLPYADDVAPPPASALSVFTPGGEVKPNIDVNAITPSPTTLPDPSEINTALNQEVPVGLPSVEGQKPKPRFFKPGGFGYEYLGGRLGENIGEFAGQQKYGTGITAEGQATGFPVDRPSLTGDLLTLPGTALNLVGDFVTDPLIAGSELAKDAASYAIGTTGVQAQQDAQAAQAALDLAATQGVTPTAETPSGSAQGQVGAVQSPFLQSPDTPSGLGGPLLRGFNMVNDASRPPNAPMGQDATRAALSGMTLNEYLNAPAGTPGVSGLRTDPQGRMIPAGFETRAEAFPDFERESAAREARLDARPDFGEAVSDRDRRAARGDDISMADQTDMAKANARGASPTEVARGNQVANALGVDLKTGQSRQATGGLTFDQVMKMEDFNFKQGQEAYKREQDDLVAQGKKTEAFEQDSALLRQVSGDAGRIGRLTNEAIGITTEPGTTALSGSLLKHVAGSDANQLKSILAVISSKVALDRLMEVKKTGATLGQVSEKELAMLQNSYDALQQSLPPERLREALTNYANQLKKVEDQTQRAFIDKHGQDKFNKIMGGGSMGQGEPRYSNDQNVGVSADTYYKPSK